MRARLLTGLLLAVFLTACGGETAGPGPGGGDGGQTGGETGGGTGGGTGGDGGGVVGANNPFRHPTGTPLVLPGGVTIVEPLVASRASRDGCEGADTLGVAYGFVELCLTIHNANATATTVTLPAGLTAVARDTTIQNGIQLQVQTVVAPAGRDTTFVWELYCTNVTRGTLGWEHEFDVGPVTDHAPMRELIQLVAPKRFTREQAEVVQHAVYDVTDGAGTVSAENRAAIAAFPAAGR